MTNGMIALYKKEVVIDIVDRWIYEHIYPSRRINQRTSSSAIALILNVAEALENYPAKNSMKGSFVLKKIREYVRSVNISGNMRKTVNTIIQNLENDKQVMSLHYDEFIFFLQWIRRLY